MTNIAELCNLAVTLRLSGPQTEVQALLTRIARTSGLQISALPLPAPLPRITQDVWQSDTSDNPSEALRGLRFQAGPVCAYVVQPAGQPVQVEFQVFAHDPCTLTHILHELPALLAILHDPDFQSAIGLNVTQPADEVC